ncbi:CFC_HP_G0102250.mRNA.1.CDS.1 [Saccharomyces cerevisiae]|nr:CFC_HP_G0102250.mRNA.1.CDS.1 [Saccharomyces cerevisiae]CAI6903721.1 CFC_HP_G0102250.mRNA.1.CDS.1 [Saccharomyces cerevisiae]
MPLNVAMPMPISTPPFIPLPLQQQPFGFCATRPFRTPAQRPPWDKACVGKSTQPGPATKI